MKTLLPWLCILQVFCCRAQQPARYGVVISEIFADPSPSAGLPAGEFLELRNTLSFPVTLDRWRITDGQGTGVIPAGTVLQPDSSLVLCPRAYQPAFSAYGQAIGLGGFPSLDNEGDQLILIADDGRLVHAVQFDVSWYGNELKKQGGWSLEMIDPRFPCLGRSNWTASMDPGGGSPGRHNSVQGIARDEEPPQLVRTYALDSMTLVAIMDEPLDSVTASDPRRYNISPGVIGTREAHPVYPLFREVLLVLTQPLQAGQLYRLQVNGLADCRLNTMPSPQESKAALASPPGPESVCINEILFDPLPGGADFVELYNKGTTAIDVSGLYLGNRNTAGQPASLVPCADIPWILYPDEYVVLTENPEDIGRQYPVAFPKHVLGLKNMPSFPDNAGTTLVTNRQGMILDELRYEDDFHFALLSSREGVSLERIDPYAKTQDPSNWHSAATGSRYGTPSGRNSQYKPPDPVPGEVSLQPAEFSPDLDGFNDQLTVQYRFPAAGYVCSITIFSQLGRPVRYLVRNELCGISGHFRWDGLDEKKGRLPAGIYFVVVDLFNLGGKRKTIRRTAVLAYKR